jgi:hypothetical protein
VSVVRVVRLIDAALFVAMAVALSVMGCAAFMKWNGGAPRVPPPGCVGDLDWEQCGSQCCDNKLGYTCHVDGCEYDGADSHEPAPTWCGGPLGCEGARRPDAGGDR